ncbi:MAG TPA: phasin family protein [Rhizomicrobium sp.]|jgi:phasin family protein
MQTRSNSAPIGDPKLVPSFWVAALILEKTERLANLHLTSAKVALEKGVESTSALPDVNGMQDLFELRNRLAQTGVQYAQAYSKDLYQVLSETQAEFSALLQRTWTSYAAAVEGWMEQSVKVAPVAPAWRLRR